MYNDYARIFQIMAGLLILDSLIIIILFMSKFIYRSRYMREKKLSQYFRNGILRPDTAGSLFRVIVRHPRLLFDMMTNLGDSVELPGELHSRLVALMTQKGHTKHILKQLNSITMVKRLRSVMNLALIGGETAGEHLYQRLLIEKKWFIRLAIIHSLSRVKYIPALPAIIEILKNAPHWVRQKSIAVLPYFGEALERQIAEMIAQPEKRDRELLFLLALKHRSPIIQKFLLDSLTSGHATLVRRAAEVLEEVSPRVLIRQKMYKHSDPHVRACGFRSLQSEPTSDSIDLLMRHLENDKEQIDAVITALQRIIIAKPLLIDTVLEEFSASQDTRRSRTLAAVLEIRLEYLLSQLNSSRYHSICTLIEVLLAAGRTAVLFGFLERNLDSTIEDTILPIIARAAEADGELYTLCGQYLPDNIVEKLGIGRTDKESLKEKAPLKRSDRRILLAVFFLVIFSGPAMYISTHYESLASFSFFEHIGAYAYAYNFFFAFYSTAINSIYLLLLFAALFYLIKQLRYWKIHSSRFLFSPELMPSISILAPAFNEEINIVNNVKSLLNLHYPDVEVIIINDGSKDRTLQRLIEHFSLERSDKTIRAAIPTEPVRGVYASLNYPNLTVIDKSNGGKADSLNAGINLAQKDFICTIDSDSLLEHDALLKIAFQSLLTDREPVAMGGNILPANGCTIRNGRLVRIQLGRNHLVRFQTIEYMRSFLAGRLGWSFLNSMVIISGAFGLFLRRRVVEIGGYLTPRSRMHAGTVGEDMELVVRLHEHLRKKKVRYKVFDAFNANCWTEVPASFKILHRQRDRWHRGLIESVLLHRKMMGNPRYGPIGLIAFPYFFLFELIGPFLELYGYVNLFISIGLGLIDGGVALLLFTAVIMYGILISVGSLIISENEVLYFSSRETILIVLYGILENFGFRQIMSMIRVTAYITFMFKEKSWGVMERKGMGSG